MSIYTQVSPPVKSTGLNGTYVLSPAESSASCPANISVYQFGTLIGLGYVCVYLCVCVCVCVCV
jgi:hypothetical protein